MSNIDDLEELHNLKEKGIISEQEFDEKKAALLENTVSENETGEKDQTVYCVLALFLGSFGIHNFYAGRWKSGLAQLLLTIPGFILCLNLVSSIWSTINIFITHTDGKGKEFDPNPTAKIVCGIFAIICSVFWFVLYSVLIVGILVAGGIAGYSMAMQDYKTAALAEKVMLVAQQTRVLYDGNYRTGDITNQLQNVGLIRDAKNAFGGDLVVTGANDEFTVTAHNIPREACVKLLRVDWGNKGVFTSIQAGYTEPVTTIGGASAATAITNCSADTQDITWTFK